MACASGLFLCAVLWCGCGEEEDWPDHQEIVGAYGAPTAPLAEETFSDFWNELVASFDIHEALGEIPGLKEKVLQGLCPQGVPCEPEYMLAVSADSKTTLNCTTSGKLVVETRGDEEGLVRRARLHADACAYTVQIGEKSFTQTVDGDIWATVFEGGNVLLVLDGTITLGDSEVTLQFDFVYDSGLWRFKIEVGDKHLVVAVDPEAGLEGILEFEASNGRYECQVDGAKLHCEDLDSDAFLDLALPK